ncbi:MAG: hypothetical protein L0H70_09010 [Xanthomonadales bacterium]|nr:hypothetical protein [Xanthomonadales bacterium]
MKSVVASVGMLATVIGSGLLLGGCVVARPHARVAVVPPVRVVTVAPARVWVPGHWRSGHVWVGGHWRHH